MAAFAQIDSIELRKISDWVENDPIIADTHVTLSGRRRRDYVAASRSWRLILSNLTQTEREGLVTQLRLNPGVRKFWIDEFGGTAAENSIDAYVTMQQTRRVPRIRLSGRDFRAGSVTLLIEAADPEGS